MKALDTAGEMTLTSIPTSISNLVKALNTLSPGPVKVDSGIKTLLQSAWNYLSGNEQTKMTSLKLNRIENMSWRPPILSFAIERHGAGVQGSSRAEIQYWEVNCLTLVARQGPIGYRQLRPMSKALDTEALSQQVAAEISKRSTPQYLEWQSDSRVRVLISKLIHETNKMTTAARRKRFRNALTEQLYQVGWYPVLGTASHTFEHKLLRPHDPKV